MYGTPVWYSIQRATGSAARERQIGRHADTRVPAVRDEEHAVILRHPPDAAAFREPAALRHVGLDHVDRALDQKGLERLAARQDLPVATRTGEVCRSSLKPVTSSGRSASSNHTMP